MEFRKIFDTIPEQFDQYRPRYCPELFLHRVNNHAGPFRFDEIPVIRKPGGCCITVESRRCENEENPDTEPSP